MKNYAAIFLLTIINLTTLAGSTTAQEITDSYFANQVKLSKPQNAQSKQDAPQNGDGPTNDNFAGAENITLSSNTLTLLKTNVGASKEANEPNHADNAGGKSVWFTITPATTQVVRLQTMHAVTNFDTTLAVYKGSNLNNLVRVGYNDDSANAASPLSSFVELKLDAGTTYRIAVDGFDGQSGTFVLTVNASESAVSNDNIGAAYDLSALTTGSVAGTNHFSTAEPNEPENGPYGLGGKSVWYRYQPQSRRAMTFEMRLNFGAQIVAYSSTVANPTFAQLSLLDANIKNNSYTYGNVAVNFAAVPSQYYFIVIDYNDLYNQNEPVTGNFQLKYYQTKLRYSTRTYGFAPQASLTLFRPSDGTWYGQNSFSSGITEYMSFGLSTDKPVPADYNGDGLTNYAVTRNQNNLKYWYILSQGSATSYSLIQWGLASDKEVAGDFDLDGIADLTVIRNVNGSLVWYVRQSTNGALRNFTFGITGDKPVMADFDGDGATDVTVTRVVDGNIVWHVLKSGYATQSANNRYTEYQSVAFGGGSDTPAAEDFDGDGKTDLAVFRQVSGTWYIQHSSTGQVQTTQFGQILDKPQPGDYDADGKADLAVYRPSAQGRWYFWNSHDNTQHVVNWGTSSDIPVTTMNTYSQQ